MAPPKPKTMRIILIVVVIFVLLVAFVGHFWSDWTHNDHQNERYKYKNYKMCTLQVYNGRGAEAYYDCPDIAMERFYLAWLFICLFGAIGSLLLVVFNKNDNKWLRLVDFILLVFLGFLLLIGVITFLTSTVQAKEYFDDRNEKLNAGYERDKKDREDKLERYRQRNITLNIEEVKKPKEYEEYYQWIIKLLASFFGLVVVFLHGYIAFLIGKPLFQEFKQGGGGNADEGAASQSAVQASPSKQGAEAKSQH